MPDVIIAKSNDIDCRSQQSQLVASGANIYKWQASSSLNDLSIPNPIATPSQSSEYIVTGINTHGCSANATINVTVYTKPDVQITQDTTICKNSNLQLFVSGIRYSDKLSLCYETASYFILTSSYYNYFEYNR